MKIQSIPQYSQSFGNSVHGAKVVINNSVAKTFPEAHRAIKTALPQIESSVGEGFKVVFATHTEPNNNVLIMSEAYENAPKINFGKIVSNPINDINGLLIKVRENTGIKSMTSRVSKYFGRIFSENPDVFLTNLDTNLKRISPETILDYTLLAKKGYEDTPTIAKSFKKFFKRITLSI